MFEQNDDSMWGILVIAGVCGVCCLGLTAIGGGAALAGGTAIGLTATSGLVRSIGGLIATGIATALPLVLIGLFLRRRARKC